MPGQIPLGQASPIFTSAIHAKYDELSEIKVNNFFRSFFPTTTATDRYPVIDIRRGSEQVAIDVMRGHQGRRIAIDKSSQKAYDPFYYKSYFDATELAPYYRVFGSTSFNVNDMAELANGVAVQNRLMADMYDRAEEIHCASVMNNGTCTSIKDGSVVDFKRQPLSMVTLTGGATWDNAGTNPYTDLAAGGDWLRQKGKYSGYAINAIFGIKAWQAYRANPAVQERLKEFNNKRDFIQPAQLASTGAIFQGYIDCDTYMLMCWTYNDVFDMPSIDANGIITAGASTPYMDPKKIYMLPEKPKFTMLYGAIPQVVALGTNTASLAVGTKIFKRYVNEEHGYDRSYLESSPLPVPLAVDQMYTLQPIA